MTSLAEPRSLGSWRLLTTGVLIAGVTVLVVGASVDFRSQRIARDFRGAYLPAAHSVLHGNSPYGPVSNPVGHYLYPPQLAFAVTPFTVFPDRLAGFLAVLVAAALLILTLRVLRVRDIRCYAALFLWLPTWNEFGMASVSPLLALALAVAWRYRNSVWPPAAALGLAIPAKLFLWPVLVWTLATRRVRTTLLAVGIGAGVTLGSWAVIGFAGLASYPEHMRNLDRAGAQASFSLVAIGLWLGLGSGAANGLAACIGAALLGGCILLARRGDEERSFLLAIAAALALTPVLWQHYLLILLVPLGFMRPRFSALWLLPVVLWVTPSAAYSHGPEKVVPLLVSSLLVAVLLGSPALRRGPATAEASA